MLPLILGLLLVLIVFTLILVDLDRKRGRLSDLIERVEPLVARDRRLHVRNMRSLNSSLFYTYSLLERLEREVAAAEKARGAEPPPPLSGLRNFHPSRRFDEVESRVAALEADAGHTPARGTSPSASKPPDSGDTAETDGDSGPAA